MLRKHGSPRPARAGKEKLPSRSRATGTFGPVPFRPIGLTGPISEPTPFPDLNAVLDDLVSSARAILGDSFVGAYLQGSFGLGDADEHSDVDFLVVVKGEPTSGQVLGLQAVHERLHDGPIAWAKRLEGSYFPADRLRQHERTGEPLLYKDNGSRILERSAHDDTLVVRWKTRGFGVALAGPPPETLIDPVPAEALKDEVRAVVRDWGGLLVEKPETMDTAWYQTFAAVMFPRMLQTLETGAVHSKRAGVEWALLNLEPRWYGLIERAWARRSINYEICFQPPDPDEVAHTVAFVRWALSEA